MTILNPDHLLDQSALLLNRPRGGPHRQADLRRAISTAYYAVFHTILTAVADRIVGRGKRNTSHYALAYRGIDHRALSSFCALTVRSPLPAKYRDCAPDGGFDNGIKTFSTSLVDLQMERHRADYDPTWQIKPSEAAALIVLARTAINLWAAAQIDQREAFPMLLLFPPR